MHAVSHFYDQYEGKLYLDNGQVLQTGDPKEFTVDKADKIIQAMERVLRRKGIIGQSDTVMHVQ
jgi:hypothetical protein